MDIDSARRLLDILVEAASSILRAGFGVNHAEAVFFSVVDLLSSESSLRAYFIEKVRITLALPDPGTIESGAVPKELIELVSHELRWRELQDLANERIERVFHGDSRFAIGDIAQGVLDAFEEKWPDREFYEKYKGGGG